MMLMFVRGMLRFLNHSEDTIGVKGLSIANRLARLESGMMRTAKNKWSLVLGRKVLSNFIRIIWFYGWSGILLSACFIVILTITAGVRDWLTIHHFSVLE